MKKTYKNRLPKNMEASSINAKVVDGEVIVEVEMKERFQPKDGDFLVSKWGCVFIYSNKKPRNKFAYSSYCGVSRVTNIISLEFSDNWTNKEGCRYATPKEKVDFLKRLEKEWNKRWNPETKELEDIRWRAEEGKYFYHIEFADKGLNVFQSTDNRGNHSSNLYARNNYFRTTDAAQKVADQIMEIFKNSKAE